LLDRKEQREYGIQRFGQIAHPTIKQFWAGRAHSASLETRRGAL
jgi:hypothetical protein